MGKHKTQTEQPAQTHSRPVESPQMVCQRCSAVMFGLCDEAVVKKVLWLCC